MMTIEKAVKNIIERNKDGITPRRWPKKANMSKAEGQRLFVTREGAKLKLAIYDLAEAAGMTRQELTAILAEELEQRISYDTFGGK